MGNDDDITANYHRGNQYSAAAHDSIKPRKQQDISRILVVLYAHPNGLTCEEVEFLLGMKHQTCSARFTDMKKMGWIIQCGKRLTRSKRDAGVWRIVQPEAQT